MEVEEPDEKFGDVWQWRSWHADWIGMHQGGRYGLLAEARRILPWFAKERLHSARFRPDGPEGPGLNEYDEGVLTAFWVRPRQLLGPYPSVSRRLATGEYFRLLGLR